MSLRKSKESEIQKMCIDYLKYAGIFCYKINNTGTYKKATGSYIPSQTKGIPDLVMHLDGKVQYIEFKSEIGKMSEHQTAFEKQCTKDGILYWVVRSLDDLIAIVEE